jgi:hypothetical protein
MQGKKQHKRFLELASGGPLFKKMIRNTTDHVMYAKELGNILEEMRCLYPLKWPYKHLRNGPLISWDLSNHQGSAQEQDTSSLQ